MATDSRASAGDWIASQTVKKVIEINNCLLGTMAGGAAVSPEKLSVAGQTGTEARIGLSVLVSVSRYAMSTSRAPPQAPYICRRSI